MSFKSSTLPLFRIIREETVRNHIRLDYSKLVETDLTVPILLYGPERILLHSKLSEFHYTAMYPQANREILHCSDAMTSIRLTCHDLASLHHFSCLYIDNPPDCLHPSQS